MQKKYCKSPLQITKVLPHSWSHRIRRCPKDEPLPTDDPLRGHPQAWNHRTSWIYTRVPIEHQRFYLNYSLLAWDPLKMVTALHLDHFAALFSATTLWLQCSSKGRRHITTLTSNSGLEQAYVESLVLLLIYSKWDVCIIGIWNQNCVFPHIKPALLYCLVAT